MFQLEFISLRSDVGIHFFFFPKLKFDFFFSQGERGSDGLPGYPGEEGSHVSAESYYFL